VCYGSFFASYRSDSTAPILNKVGAFLTDPILRRIVTRPERQLQIRQIMDSGKVLIVNLAKDRIGEDSASLRGGLLVTTVGLAALSNHLASSRIESIIASFATQAPCMTPLGGRTCAADPSAS
jgi:hypothetical protein